MIAAAAAAAVLGGLRPGVLRPKGRIEPTHPIKTAAALLSFKNLAYIADVSDGVGKEPFTKSTADEKKQQRGNNFPYVCSKEKKFQEKKKH